MANNSKYSGQYSSSSGIETATTIGALIGGADDATPNDTDFVATSLTAAGILKKITWTNVVTYLRTKLDSIYQATLVSATNIKTINSTSLLGSGDIAVGGGDVSKSGDLVNDSLVVGAGASSVKDKTLSANTVVVAHTANTPIGLAVNEQTIVGRKTGANIDDLSATEVRTILNVEDNADVTDAANIASSIDGVANKATPVDADKVGYINTEAGNVLVTSTWTNIKAFLKTYFDGLYFLKTVFTAADEIQVGTGAGTTNQITLAASQFLGKKAAGAATNLTATESRAILNVASGADVTGDNAPQAHNQAETTLTFTDVTTNDVSTSAHGFVPKGTNTGDYLKDDGTWDTPAGAGDMILASVQSVTGLKTFDTTKIAVKGSSTGSTAIASANSSATDYTATLPAKTGTVAMTSDITGTNSGTNTGDETATSLGALIGGADDATPNDTDFIATSLTAAGILKKITWTNVKAFLKTYFDTVYAAVLGADDNYVTNAEKTVIGNTSNTNTGDNAANTSIAATKLDDFATPDDNTDLNVSTSTHGLCPKLTNVSTDFLNGQGGYTTPAGGGDMVLASVQSVTGLKTFDTTKAAIKGSSTGVTAIASANASATDYTATLPAKTGTVAMTSDITGTNSGTNTGDNAANTSIAATKLDDFATPDDNTDLNATTTEHGLSPKLSDVETEFLNGKGVFSVPAGGGGGTVATGTELDTATDNAKFASALALKNSHNIPSIDPGDAGDKIISDGTDWIISTETVMTDTTVNFTSGMSAATIQALIDAVPKNIAVGVTVTFQFADGTYTLADTILFGGFWGGGNFYVDGNSSNNSLSTTKAVILNGSGDPVIKFTGNRVAYIRFWYCKVEQVGANNRDVILLNTNFCSVDIRYLYVVNYTSSYRYNLYFINCYMATQVLGCYFTEGVRAICAASSHVLSNGNDDVGTQPDYGLYASSGVIMKNGTQPTGYVSDEGTANGGVIR